MLEAAAPAIRARATVRTTPALRRWQAVHAALTTLVPLAGTLVAAMLAVRDGIGGVELARSGRCTPRRSSGSRGAGPDAPLPGVGRPITFGPCRRMPPNAHALRLARP
jgi:hypothetical protein